MKDIIFHNYVEEDYEGVYDFFINLNYTEKTHINWNWARWEWMYFHEDFDREMINSIGLWMDKDKVVGIAVYDYYFGEAFCGALSEYKELLHEIIEYARTSFMDDGGLGIAVNDEDIYMEKLFIEKGFEKVEQDENILKKDLDEDITYTLDRGYSIKSIQFPQDSYKYQLVLWKGFDHGDSIEEFEESFQDDRQIPIHLNSNFCLAVVNDKDEYVAHCTCWYDKNTDYVYVEPVCTIPECRKKGLGKAIVCEALNRCREAGAKKAYVISDQEFYKNIGFKDNSHYTFWWIH